MERMHENRSSGRITRRGVLSAAGLAGAGIALRRPALAADAARPDPAITEVQDWQRRLGDGVDKRPYGAPSKFEQHVVRRHVPWLMAAPQTAANFTPLHALEGIITPSGLCFERHHSGIAEIDPAKHRLMINGLVEKPLVFTMDDIRRMPRLSRICFLECAANTGMEWRGAQLNGCQFTHGMIHNVMYTGVPLKLLLDEAGLKPNAKWLMLEGGDAAGMNRSLPIGKALSDVMLAFAMNGEALRPEQGYPLRAVIPGWEGNLWVKWLRRIEVGDKPWAAREETSKYTDLLASGRARQYTFVMDAKSVVTNPSPQAPLKYRGRNLLSGFAWSGRGSIKRVDVSLDGGRNWTTARQEAPVLDKSMTRFYLDLDWNGEELLVQSRAMDSSGYAQPTKDALRKIRGVNSVYHNNAIQSWLVRGNGEVENVELG
jgi:sulfane dehydrogenase subunit SoxC